MAAQPSWARAQVAEPRTERAVQPNIVLIVLDDLDLQDLGAYQGADIQTPEIDALAAQGMKFTQYYVNCPMCSPSRAAMLTGRFPGSYSILRPLVEETSFRGIPGAVVTLAHVLREAGYHTAHIGKWHLGQRRSEFLPDVKGFDQSVRRPAGSEYVDFDLVINEDHVVHHGGSAHMTETLTDYAISFLNGIDGSRPFFLNFWHLAPHAPLHVPSNFDNSNTQYDLGTNRGQFSAMLTHADQHIGRLLDEIDRLGLASSTIVLLTSDNGGTDVAHGQPGRFLRGFKSDVFEGGIRVPLIVRWPGRVAAGSANDSLVLAFDLFPTLARIANADTTGLDLPGRSFLQALLRGQVLPRDEMLFWEIKRENAYFESPGGNWYHYAVRDGDWKYVFFDDERDYLFNLGNDVQEHHNLVELYPDRASDMRDAYWAWRRGVGLADYQMRFVGHTGLLHDDSQEQDFIAFGLNGGRVDLRHDLRLDPNDGDFSFVADVHATDFDGEQTLAQKRGSWRLWLSGARVVLMVHGQNGGRVLLRSPPLSEGETHHIAFTILGWRDSRTSVRLYVDGQLLADSAEQPIGINSVRSTARRIALGNNDALTTPFHGYMSKPRLSTISLSSTEILMDLAPR
jgi:arylsulfatase A-like enzyme